MKNIARTIQAMCQAIIAATIGSAILGPIEESLRWRSIYRRGGVLVEVRDDGVVRSGFYPVGWPG